MVWSQNIKATRIFPLGYIPGKLKIGFGWKGPYLRAIFPFCVDEVHMFFYRQLDFSSEPGVADEIFKMKPKVA